MNLEISYDKTLMLYKEYLNSIKGVNFTYREIDVIACIMNNRGEKKIASLLMLSPRTVGTHIHNIMLKLNCNSREYIIDFIEKSGKLLILKEYYPHLLLQLSFKNHLIKIAKECNKQCSNHFFKSDQLSAEENNMLQQLKEHLKLANVIWTESTKSNIDEKADFYIVSECFSKKQKKSAQILLLFNNKFNYIQNINSPFIDFSKKEEYYFLVLEIISKILSPNVLEPIKQQFKDEYQVILSSWVGANKDIKDIGMISAVKESWTNRNLNILLFCVVTIILLLSLSMIHQFFSIRKEIKLENIIYDLPLPHPSILLDRTAILKNINRKLNGNGIQVVALLGSGGSGKTTTARQYARGQKIPLVWEINSETAESILSSFEQLAYVLCQTEEDKQEIQIIQKMKDISDREKKLYVFLKKRIKSYDNWLIIYNNVETFEDIIKHFPYDPKVWGNGKVIITTRNSNIGCNNYIPSDHVIQVEELNENEKLLLFSKIKNNARDYSATDKLIISDFLRKIPPFPLDVSLAAYYLKEEDISYEDYLKHLSESKEEFVSFQGNILKDLGGYNKTRYDIVILSIKRIIETNQEFVDLLLLISMLDSKDIPKDLLVNYKNNIMVSKFMHELRKFSLINEEPQFSSLVHVFSMHQDTQRIILDYLFKIFKANGNINQLNAISNILAEYAALELETSNSSRIPLFINHAETFLSHKELLDKVNVAKLDVQLGNYYFRIANYIKAKILLQKALKVYNKQYGKDHIKTAWVLARLGTVYRNMENYSKAKELLEHALKIHKDKHGEECTETASISTYLGSVYTITVA